MNCAAQAILIERGTIRAGRRATFVDEPAMSLELAPQGLVDAVSK
jgi:hypothetical protein